MQAEYEVHNALGPGFPGNCDSFGAERVQSSLVVNTKGKAKLPPSFPDPHNLPRNVA